MFHVIFSCSTSNASTISQLPESEENLKNVNHVKIIFSFSLFIRIFRFVGQQLSEPLCNTSKKMKRHIVS